ncbi:MAG: hypothetical protein JW993_04345 [Sedimentisphaerales bacterium]|nr:hypothetical protein [Sedimentisphaerales bacterium]
MKTVKRMLLIGATILVLLSLAGCMVIECDDCRPAGPRRVRRSPPCQLIVPSAVARS